MFRDKQQILIWAVAGGIIAGFFLFRLLPLRKKLQAANDARSAKMLAAAEARAQIEQLPALEQELEQLKTRVGDFDAKIPDHRDLGQFLHRIADLMNEYDLRDQQIQPRDEIEADRLHCIPVSMECKGGLKQVFDFFTSLQSLSRLVRIEQVRLQNDNEFSGQVTMKTEAVVYYSSQTRPG